MELLEGENPVGTEIISEKYVFCTATHKDIPELVRMRLKLQEHMEQANNLILRYKDEWRNELPLLYKKLLNNSNVIIIKAITKEDHGVVGMMVGCINEQLRLLNSFCQEIPGSTIALKKKEFSKLLGD